MIWPATAAADPPVPQNAHLPFLPSGTRAFCSAAPEEDVSDGLNNAAKINTNYNGAMKCRANRGWSIPDGSVFRPDLSSATTAFSYSTPLTITMVE